VSFKIIMMMSVTSPCFKTHQTFKMTQNRFFWSETGLVLRLTVSDHITGPSIIMSIRLMLDLIFSFIRKTVILELSTYSA